MRAAPVSCASPINHVTVMAHLVTKGRSFFRVVYAARDGPGRSAWLGGCRVFSAAPWSVAIAGPRLSARPWCAVFADPLFRLCPADSSVAVCVRGVNQRRQCPPYLPCWLCRVFRAVGSGRLSAGTSLGESLDRCCLFLQVGNQGIWTDKFV